MATYLEMETSETPMYGNYWTNPETGEKALVHRKHAEKAYGDYLNARTADDKDKVTANFVNRFFEKKPVKRITTVTLAGKKD